MSDPVVENPTTTPTAQVSVQVDAPVANVPETVTQIITPSTTDTPILYVIKDKLFPDFAVLKRDPTLGGIDPWWYDQKKLYTLISGFKRGMPVKQALIYAVITPTQYYHFAQEYPMFHYIKECCEQRPNLQSIETVTGDLRNVQTAKWWLERRMSDEFGTKEKGGGTGNNFGTVINADTVEVKGILSDILKQNGNDKKV